MTRIHAANDFVVYLFHWNVMPKNIESNEWMNERTNERKIIHRHRLLPVALRSAHHLSSDTCNDSQIFQRQTFNNNNLCKLKKNAFNHLAAGNEIFPLWIRLHRNARAAGIAIDWLDTIEQFVVRLDSHLNRLLVRWLPFHYLPPQLSSKPPHFFKRWIKCLLGHRYPYC